MHTPCAGRACPEYQVCLCRRQSQGHIAPALTPQYVVHLHAVAGAHHNGENDDGLAAAQEHQTLDAELAKADERDASAVLEYMQGMRKSATSPNNDKVALLANYRTVGLKIVNAAHVSKSDQQGKAEGVTGKAAAEQQDDVKVQDPDGVKGRRLLAQHHRRLLRLQ